MGYYEVSSDGTRTLRYQSRPLARPTHMADIGADCWRGGQVIATDAASVTVRLLHQLPNYVGVHVVDRSLLAAGVELAVGQPVVARMAGEELDLIPRELRAGVWAAGNYPIGDEAASVAAGFQHFAILNGVVDGIGVYLDGANSITEPRRA